MRRVFTIVIESDSRLSLSEAWSDVWRLANKLDNQTGVSLESVHRTGREED